MSADRVTAMLADLVAINSVNPAYPGGAGEADIAAFVERQCREWGLEVVRQPVLPGRENVIATLAVPGATETLVLEAHMDTVALEPMGEDGLRAVVRDDRLYGRGACDTKGSLAAMMVAIERLRHRRTDLPVNVALLAAVDEEHGATGIRAFSDSDMPASAAVIGEPTDLRVVIAHKGCVRGTIRVEGRAAHSAEPERGISAIEGMADLLVRLRALDERFAARRHPLVGGPAFTVGMIEGGIGVNIVPAACAITYDRRTIPGEDPAAALAEIDTLLDEMRHERPDLVIVRDAPYLIAESLDTDPSSSLVAAARAACVAADLDDEPIGVPYGSDASKLQAGRGIPAIVFGPGSIGVAHGADEYVPIRELERAVAFYEHLALHDRSPGRNGSA